MEGVYYIRTVMPFGRYKGMTVGDAMTLSFKDGHRHTYFDWCVNEIPGFKLGFSARYYYSKLLKSRR